MRVSYEIFTVPKQLFELRRCSNNRKSNYRESTVYFSNQIGFDLNSINQEFLLFLILLKKPSIQYLTIQFLLFNISQYNFGV